MTSRHLVRAIAAIWLFAAHQACARAPEPTGPTADASPIPASASEVGTPAPDTFEVANGAEFATLGRAEMIRSDGNGDRHCAFVIGNGAYRNGDALTAPAKDAALMAAALGVRGYQVLLGIDRASRGCSRTRMPAPAFWNS